MQLKTPLGNDYNKNNILVPKYDINSVKSKTMDFPAWLHFGAGNIFRGYIARLQDDLLNQGIEESGIVACETFDSEVIQKIYKPYDNLVLLATLSSKKPVEYRVIASIGDSIDIQNPNDFVRLGMYFQNPKLQMVSLTITEKGYALTGLNQKYLSVIEKDIEEGPIQCRHTISVLVALLYKRYICGGYPLAFVSMDNCSHNGEKLENAMKTIASAWYERGYVEHDFISYLDSNKVTFPWSMIDKITPRPAMDIAIALEKLGLEDMQPITTRKKTFIAPFVNAEVSEYLVIEDDFPNGRPELEKAGVIFADRKTVNEVETMKVTTCLNPLHTALAVFGVPLGYETIYEEMQDLDLKRLIEGIASEGMKVVTDPKVISPKEFVEEVIEERLPNPSVLDSPWRIATDTSLKIPIRYGKTIEAYIKDSRLSVDDLVYIPLAIAGWLRYLLGIDDNLKTYTPSADPQLEDLQDEMKGIVVGDITTYKGQVKRIISNSKIFGVDLKGIKVMDKIENMFVEMLEGEKAIRKVLHKYVGNR